MNCTKCGNLLDAGAAFCGNCGQQIITTSAAMPAQPQASPLGNPVFSQGSVQASPYQPVPTPIQQPSPIMPAGNLAPTQVAYQQPNPMPASPAGSNTMATQFQQAQPINTYRIPALISFLVCGGVFAIPALILSMHADSALKAGNLAEAQTKARQAKTATIVAASFGAVVLLIVLAAS